MSGSSSGSSAAEREAKGLFVFQSPTDGLLRIEMLLSVACELLDGDLLRDLYAGDRISVASFIVLD